MSAHSDSEVMGLDRKRAHSEPAVIPCDGCGKPATIRRYVWLKPTQFFCDDCKGKP